MTWSASEYTEFALRHQLRSLWQIATYITLSARRHGADRVRGPWVDLGAGPALLSRFVAHLNGNQVEAAVQNQSYLRLAEEILPALGVAFGGQVGVRLDEALTLDWLEAPPAVTFSYACLHEWAAPGSVLNRAYGVLAAGGLLVVVDTAREALPAVQAAMKRSSLDPRAQAAVVETFAASLSLGEAYSLAAALPPGCCIRELELDEEVLMESELSFPLTADEADGVSIPGPAMYCIEVAKHGR